MAEELTAKILRFVWRSPEQDAVVARGRTDKGEEHTLIGPDGSPPLSVDLQYRFGGDWTRHQTHGTQFRFATYTPLTPHDRKGVIAYLVTVAPNVGERRAAKLWETFGPAAVETLREHPQQVPQTIMPPTEARAAAEALRHEQEFEATRIELLGLLSGRGFQLAKLIKAAIAKWGVRAPALIRRNPYLLMFRKMPGAGWNRCDKLYLDLGHAPARMKRQALCAAASINAHREGHTWHSASAVGDMITKAIGADKAKPFDAITLALRAHLLAGHRDKEGQVWLAISKRADSEITVARKLKELSRWRIRPTGTALSRLSSLLLKRVEPTITEPTPASFPTSMMTTEMGGELIVGDANP